ncbi:5433_t:CDS:1, partial [Gigaspora rosea]
LKNKTRQQLAFAYNRNTRTWTQETQDNYVFKDNMYEDTQGDNMYEDTQDDDMYGNIHNNNRDKDILENASKNTQSYNIPEEGIVSSNENPEEEQEWNNDDIVYKAENEKTYKKMMLC